jgi:hypothetical protein
MIAIGTHPLVQNASIFNPAAPVDQPPEPVRITKFRLYGGKELLTNELTLSLFPAPKDLGGGSGKYIQLAPQTLGPNYADGYADSMLGRFHLELCIRLPEFDAPVEINYQQINNALNTWSPTDNLLYGDAAPVYVQQQGLMSTTNTFSVTVLPAEELLRDWISVLRYVIRDIRHLRPYEVRNLQITDVVYDSSGIFDTDKVEALVFHRATIQFELRWSEGGFGR